MGVQVVMVVTVEVGVEQGGRAAGAEDAQTAVRRGGHRTCRDCGWSPRVPEFSGDLTVSGRELTCIVAQLVLLLLPHHGQRRHRAALRRQVHRGRRGRRRVVGPPEVLIDC